MNIVTEIDTWQRLKKEWPTKTIGFIPTMGHLHDGHMSLCKSSQATNDMTVVSIFVNPTQFNEAKDFNLYPRTLEQDTELLLSHKIDCLFLPKADAIYHDGYQFKMTENDCSLELEGKYRPEHFNGMLTVVLKLLNIIQPTHAYFGEKDYQQLLLIQKMAAALFIPVDIVGCETIRATDGLALSSRNSRLTPAQRVHAAHFPRLLKSAADDNEVINELIRLGFRVDYIEKKWQRRLGAVWLDEIRLIDNVAI